MKKFDFYRRVPKDLTEPTAPGAIISVVCLFVMVLLFLGEVVSYVSPPLRSDMYVAPDEGQGSKLKVTFNMSYYRLPCFALSFDVLDILGRHEMGVSDTTKKLRISRDGTPIGPFAEQAAYHDQREEGCNIEGFVNIAKVPGNFHVSAHGLMQVVMQYLGGSINVQHKIHHLSFGDVNVVGDHDFEGHVHPLNGEVHRDDDVMHYEYYLDVVPTVYAKGRKSERGYQFTANMHKTPVPYGQMAAVFFRYQLSPITVKYSKESVGFLHFLTYMCAIIGGVFTVAGILSRMLHTSLVQFQRRVLGKDQ